LPIEEGTVTPQHVVDENEFGVHAKELGLYLEWEVSQTS
jgi:hypothetical protein